MSTPDTHAAGHDDGHGHGEAIRAEPDLVPVGLVISGLIVIYVIFAVGVFWSYRIQRREEGLVGGYAEDTTDMPKPIGAYKYEVGIVNQKQFEQEKRAYTQQADERQGIEQYGWTDREKKLVHVPLEEGAKKVMAQGAGQQQPQGGGEK